MSTLSIAVERLIHCLLGKTSCTLRFILIYTNRERVLPSGQYVKHCREKDNTDINDQYQQTVASCESITNTFIS